MEYLNAFPGYEWMYFDSDKRYHNVYRGVDLGKGGYIISNAGIYENVALLDVTSLHPHSIIAMNCFGKYTQNFQDLMEARIFIKHGDYDSAKKLFGGKLAKYLDDPQQASALAQALKIGINACYGMTSANFENIFKDPRNVNNIVALRGALFMKTLQDEVEAQGYKIVAIKTDSIKIADATNEIIDFCMKFAQKYGYTFEHEATYDRICQVNDADYIAKYMDPDWCQYAYGYIPGDNKKHPKEWTVTGAKFAVPYVFKTLFSKEPIQFADMCETKSVKTAIYIDRTPEEAAAYINNPDMATDADDILLDNGHSLRFVGKVGLFTPVKEGCGGGTLVRQGADKDGNTKYDSVTGSKGYLWMESEMVQLLGKEDCIDKSYYTKMVDDAVEAISQYGDFERFVSDEPYISPWEAEEPPWDDTTPFDVR